MAAGEKTHTHSLQRGSPNIFVEVLDFFENRHLGDWTHIEIAFCVTLLLDVYFVVEGRIERFDGLHLARRPPVVNHWSIVCDGPVVRFINL